MVGCIYTKASLKVSKKPSLHVALIGGHDSTGGAGILADQETVTAHGHLSKCLVTAITLQQNPSKFKIVKVHKYGIESQLADLTDHPVDALKIGMLPDRETVIAVTDFIYQNANIPVILDPVLKTSKGNRLIDQEGWKSMIELLLPQIDLITPNIDEALEINSTKATNQNPIELAKRWIDKGANAVLIKGGHLKGEFSTDTLLTQNGKYNEFQWPRIDGGSEVRGTGCRLASAIACNMGEQLNIEDAVRRAGDYLQSYLFKKLS